MLAREVFEAKPDDLGAAMNSVVSSIAAGAQVRGGSTTVACLSLPPAWFVVDHVSPHHHVTSLPSWRAETHQPAVGHSPNSGHAVPDVLPESLLAGGDNEEATRHVRLHGGHLGWYDALLWLVGTHWATPADHPLTCA